MAEQEISPLARTDKPRFFYGYVVVAISFGIQLTAWGMIPAFGVFFNSLLKEFNWPRAVISGAHSLCFLINGVMGIVMGGINDRFGPQMVMAVCGFIFGLGYLLMSQVNAVWQLYLFYGVIVGIGLSCVDVILLSTVARWFVKKRGTMSGIVKVGAGVGMMVMPLAASGLISIYEWRTSYTILGAISLLLLVVFAWLLRRDPSQMHQFPDGDEETTISNLGSPERGLSFWEARRTSQFWTICVAFLAFFCCAQALIAHIVPHAVDLGISLTSAASIISVMGAASIVGRLGMGNAGDRFGNKRAMVVCYLVLVTGLFWLQFASGLWALYLFALAYGFSHGGIFALYSPLLAGLFGTRSHGVILGIVTFVGTVGAAVGPLFTGRIFDITNSYQLAFLVMFMLAIIGLVLTISLKPVGEGGIVNESRRSA